MKLDNLSKLVTMLVRDERIEHTYSTLSEARDYAERLIAEAVQHGDCHQPTMELADFWLKEKQLVHKLFKVSKNFLFLPVKILSVDLLIQ